MCPLRQHQSICVEGTKEMTHFIDVVWCFLFKNGRNEFFPRLESSWCQPISKKIHFLDSPGTGETLFCQIELDILPMECQWHQCCQGIHQHYWVHIGLVPWFVEQIQRYILGPLASVYICICQNVWWSHTALGTLHQVKICNITSRCEVL